MKRLLILAAALAVIAHTSVDAKPRYNNPSKKTMAIVDENIDFALEQTKYLYHTYLESDKNMHPRTVKSNGEFEGAGVGWWTSGFFPGVMWYLYEYSDDAQARTIAEEMTDRVMVRQRATNSHDVGFQINCSAGNAYRLSGEQKYSDAMVNGCRALASRFSPVVGCTRSWSHKPWHFPVIIDNMMNLEILCAGSMLAQDMQYVDMATSHADRSKEVLYREDNSCYHVADFDAETGKVIELKTHQGYSNSSAWARGQAWGLYGFTMLYRFTNKSKYLEQAKAIAKFMIHHPNMPEDLIPYWDYDAPNIPDASRDVSAAAVMASALLELSTYLGNTPEGHECFEVAQKQVLRLCKAPYRSAKVGDNCGFILTKSVGFMAKKSEVDAPLTYADYYFVEAMMRLKELSKGEPIGESYNCDCE